MVSPSTAPKSPPPSLRNSALPENPLPHPTSLTPLSVQDALVKFNPDTNGDLATILTEKDAAHDSGVDTDASHDTVPENLNSLEDLRTICRSMDKCVDTLRTNIRQLDAWRRNIALDPRKLFPIDDAVEYLEIHPEREQELHRKSSRDNRSTPRYPPFDADEKEVGLSHVKQRGRRPLNSILGDSNPFSQEDGEGAGEQQPMTVAQGQNVATPHFPLER